MFAANKAKYSVLCFMDSFINVNCVNLRFAIHMIWHVHTCTHNFWGQWSSCLPHQQFLLSRLLARKK